jgi:periplasmic divalent cation tolerance protein
LSDGALEIQVACPDAETARAIGTNLVEARLAACATVSGPTESIFRWQGGIEAEREWILSAKTRAPLFEAAAAMIRERHPYDVPAILAVDALSDAATAAWLDAETGRR